MKEINENQKETVIRNFLKLLKKSRKEYVKIVAEYKSITDDAKKLEFSKNQINKWYEQFKANLGTRSTQFDQAAIGMKKEQGTVGILKTDIKEIARLTKRIDQFDKELDKADKFLKSFYFLESVQTDRAILDKYEPLITVGEMWLKIKEFSNNLQHLFEENVLFISKAEEALP